MAEFKVDVSTLGDGVTSISSYGLKTSSTADKTDYNFTCSRLDTKTRISDRFNLNSDTKLSDKLSWFYFWTDDLGSYRTGIGMGCRVSDYVKLSFAMVNDNQHGVIGSFRYKYQETVGAYSFLLTTFILGYTYNVDYRAAYSFNKNFAVLYKGYYDDASGMNQSSFGLEVSL